MGHAGNGSLPPPPSDMRHGGGAYDREPGFARQFSAEPPHSMGSGGMGSGAPPAMGAPNSNAGPMCGSCAAPAMGNPSSSAMAESKAALERALPREEAELLRLSDESKQLANELVEMRFKHCKADDAAGKIERQLIVLDTLIGRSQADRAHLEEHGTLPPPTFRKR